jgi:hypothetical protein
MYKVQVVMYQVECECGIVHSVAGVDAGRSMPCSCGITIEIPLLSQLRRMAGEATISPELEIEVKLASTELPEGIHCVACGDPTQCTTYVNIECESVTRSNNRKITRGCSQMIFLFLFGWIGLLLIRASQANQEDDVAHGRDIRFQLPIRLCRTCSDKSHDFRVLLEQTPVYSRLLKKYPHSKIGYGYTPRQADS